jgi:hypothetical protein
MVDESARKPLTDFRVVKALNGGWILTPNDRDPGYRPDAHAFTNAADMLAALPGLIGAVPDNEAAMIARLDAARRALGVGSLMAASVDAGPTVNRLVPRGV